MKFGFMAIEFERMKYRVIDYIKAHALLQMSFEKINFLPCSISFCRFMLLPRCLTYVNIDFCFELANGNMGGIWNTFVVTKYDPILYTDMF